MLSFLLARSASRESDRRGLSSAAWQLAANEHRDDSTTINLLIAIQLLAAYDALDDEPEGSPNPVLASLLLSALERPAAVQAAALPVIGVLHTQGMLARMAPAIRAELRRRLLAAARDDELVRMEWPMIEPFLAGN